ncbi:tetratricopeptide repeat protein [Methylophilaceae bacterium]|nr:tetratricopeptide repeat protein [Methylophilaceae bacterium]
MALNKLRPSETEVNSLLEHYQNGRFDNAEKLAISITEKFPQDQFSWKVLGALLQQTGRVAEALVASKKSVETNPNDAEAYNNLGSVLNSLDKIEEAEKNFKKAIALKPDFFQAHSNLGITLHKFGKLEEAQESHRNAIAMNPDYAEAYCNLGMILQDLGKLEEAEENHRHAILLKPDCIAAHNGLGIVLQELHRLKEALTVFKTASLLMPDYAEVLLNLSIAQDYSNNLDAAILQLENILAIDSILKIDSFGLRAAILLAIFRFLEDDFSTSKKLLLSASQIQDKITFDDKAYKIYQIYLLKILSWHENKPLENLKNKSDKILYVIGESHGLVSHGLSIRKTSGHFLCKSLLIMGCKQWHLGNSIKNKYKFKFESLMHSLSKSSEILLSIGEIDCRLEEGIIKYNNKYPEKSRTELITATVENYLNYVHKINFSYQHKITIQGVPCPNIDISDISKEKVIELIDLIREFNIVLKDKSTEIGFSFLDVYKLSDRGDGFSNLIWHLDSSHLSPEAMKEAWQLHLNLDN